MYTAQKNTTQFDLIGIQVKPGLIIIIINLCDFDMRSSAIPEDKKKHIYGLHKCKCRNERYMTT